MITPFGQRARRKLKQNILEHPPPIPALPNAPCPTPTPLPEYCCDVTAPPPLLQILPLSTQYTKRRLQDPSNYCKTRIKSSPPHPQYQSTLKNARNSHPNAACPPSNILFCYLPTDFFLGFFLGHFYRNLIRFVSSNFINWGNILPSSPHDTSIGFP